MKKNKDFIYEYSDLNMLQTRVLVKTGIYKDLIFDFTSARIDSGPLGSQFSFGYTLYQKPLQFENTILRGNPQFEKFIADLVIAVILARRKDKKELEKLSKAAGPDWFQNSKIKVDSKFYPEHHCVNPLNQTQPQVQGMQEF
jgi:hypothetical protein